MSFPLAFEGRVWGDGVFENDGALLAVTYLNELAGLDKMEPTLTATGENIVYSLFAAQCSSQTEADSVREHLDSGVHKSSWRQ